MICLGIFACNQIVGVEDVRLRATGSRPVTTDTGDADTGNPGPDPTTPISDAATDAGSGCAGTIACVRKVFLTSQTFGGNLGGLAGADAHCYTAAQQIPALKGRVFRAWLSDATTNAADRIHHGTQAFLRGDGSTFVTSYRTLIGGTVANALNIDENGNTRTGATLDLGAWTGTDATGVYNLNSCNNWTSAASTDNGAAGDSQATDRTWTQFSSGTSCNSSRHLYCIEY